ncbi:hypothetical protein [Sphingobacterium sp. HSC-15S19]|uniref:hypothetical protein n=1 Tax=Sphingobacterium sp. HSC-15S19 TaxID=2910971 RepID=UPI003D1B4B87
MNNNKEEEFDKNLLKRKDEAIKELYTTGRYKGLYMGRESSSSHNPIVHYISGWLKSKGWSDEKISREMGDFYNELFKEVYLIKLEKWPELLDNPKKLTATICLMAQRHLFRDVNEKYPSAKSYYEKNKRFSTEYDKEIKRINHSELTENDDEYIIEDDQETGFEKKYKIDVDVFIALMTEEQRQLFYRYINKKGTGKKGRFNNADREKYNEILEQITKDCKDILRRLNS